MNSTLPLVVPPEESAHELTFMQWPVSREVHPDPVFLRMLQNTIADIANTISEFEPVVMLCAKEHHKKLRKRLSSAVDLWDIPTEDLWCRDSGPLFAIDDKGDRVISHIKFNGWGDKQVHKNDGKVVSRIAEALGIPIIDSGLWGEAGGVEHDGHGLLIAHESSWLNDNRNPNLSRAEIEQRLLAAYGAKNMIWSAGVWGEDITDYHIDSLARLTSPATVLINLPDTPDDQDPFHIAALDTHDKLVAANINVHVIPEPNKRRVKGIDFVASYANYYACNNGVVAAEFGDAETDEIALNALKEHYPGREVVTLNVDTLGEVGGGIHCATQQMPIATSR
jgi:agmatine deiminase